VTPEEQLEREAAGRRLAVAAAVAAVILQVVASTVGSRAARGAPDAGLPGAPLELPRFYSQHATGLIAAAVLLAASYLATGVALDYLYRATKFRRPEIPAVARVTTYAGPVMLALGTILFQVVLSVESSEYLAHHQGDYVAARQIGTSAVSLFARGVGQAGALALGFAFVLVALNAMRVGLLTRFLGVMGIISGVLFVLPLGGQGQPILWFWLGALAYLFAGRWPGGVPPAWQTGRAEPWPSAQELRARRQEEAAASPAPPAASPSPPRRRSRKRRARDG
jgi:hypothetical protein